MTTPRKALTRLALVAAVSLAVPAVPIASAATPTVLEDAEAQALLEQYQPVMRFASVTDLAPTGLDPRVELFRPSDPEDFLRMATLEKRTLLNWKPYRTKPPSVSLSKWPFGCTKFLDTRCWRLNIAGLNQIGGVAAERAYLDRWQSLPRAEGAQRFVVLGRAVRGGDTRAAYRNWHALQYWSFYVYNAWSKPPGTPGAVFQAHEGDWENAVVLLDADKQPRAVAYSQHSRDLMKPWSEVELTADGHPVQYVARGSHAGYFQPGYFAISTGFKPIDSAVDPVDVTGTVPDGSPCPGPDQPLYGVPVGTVSPPPCSAEFPVRLAKLGQMPVSFRGHWGGGQSIGAGTQKTDLLDSPVSLAARPAFHNPLMETLGVNLAPVASFALTPAQPVAGQPFTLTDTSRDRATLTTLKDGGIKYRRWETGRDGDFRDGDTTTIKLTLPAGSYPISLKVRDGSFGSSVITRTIVVNPAG